MAQTKRTFIAGKMNMDIDERMLPDGQYRSASNITIEATGGSNMGAVQNALGNEMLYDVGNFLLNSLGIQGGGKTIGAVAYEPLSLIYWFVKFNSFDGIFEYNQKTNVTSLILGSMDGTLNFDATALITGVNYIHTEDGGFLFWTDNLNPPRRINISRARSYSVDDPRIKTDIDVILRPPLKSPRIVLLNSTDNIESNNLEEKFLYFSYRYKYIDNEFSSMSPFSSVAFNAKALSLDPNTGDNVGMLNKNNMVQIGFDTGNQFVQEIQILARDTRSLNVLIIDTLNKVDLGYADNVFKSFIFRNNKIYSTLPSDQVTRMFDNVPLKAQAQEIIGNRLIYGNYTQFRDVSQLSYTVNYSSTATITASTADPKRTFRSDRDYEVGIVYSDDYGRLTTVLTSKDNNTNNNSSSSVYIPPANSHKPNHLITTIKSLPPSWATSYRLYIKQSKKDYYNLFPISFQVLGEYRYILISDSDRDKVSVGQYIIYKTSNNIPTNSNKKFKVLEIELKAVNDINTGSPAGLYIKIKPDPISGSSFLAAPTMTTTNSTYWATMGTHSANVQAQIPYCFNAPAFHYDTVHYRIGSTYFTSALNSAPAIGLTGSISKDDVRLKVKIVPNPLSPNSSNATHFIINTDPANQNAWTSPVPIPTGATYSVNTQVPSSAGNMLLNFGVGNYVVGDIYVFNIRGYYFNSISTRASVKSPRGGSGIPGTNFNSYSWLTPTMPVQGGSNVPVVANGWQYGYTGELSVAFAGPIYTGAKITITVNECQGATCTPVQSFTTILPLATKNYPSFEEFFWEQCTGVTIDVVSNNGTDPTNINYAFRYVRTLIGVSGSNCGQYTWINNPSVTQNGGSSVLSGVPTFKSALFFWANCTSTYSQYTCSATLEQAEVPTSIIETVPIEVEAPIFHETTKTYPIKNGYHGAGGWNYYAAQSAAVAGGFSVILTSNDMHYFSLNDTVWRFGLSYTVIGITSFRQITIFSLTSLSGTGTIYSMQGESDQTASSNANIFLNCNNENSDYNAFCYGNGLESYRIRDSFNDATMKYSIRASTVIEDYEQEYKFSSLTYSGVYRGDSSINRLNEFNLSLANFKNLEKDYGSIQKLYTRDSDLLVLHQDKITSVLFGKNLLVDALGGGQVASIPEVLGNQIPYQLDNGISNDPASFAVNSDNIYFTDAKRGVVIEMIGNQGIMEISSKGMRNYFRDLLTENISTQKIGAYDPYYNMYTLTTNNTRNSLCALSIDRTSLNIYYGAVGTLLAFTISTYESWSLSLIDTGFGTNWISLNQTTGTGTTKVYVNQALSIPGPSLPRTMTIRVSYCGGKIADFTLTQKANTPLEASDVIILNS